MASVQKERSPEESEQYCSSCGEIIKQEAEICPECGVRNEYQSAATEESGTLGYVGYTILGLLSATLAFLFLPPVFGAIAIFCGYQVYKRHHELAGIGLMMYGSMGLVLGMVIGMIAW